MTTWDSPDVQPDDFATLRHIGPSRIEIASMLEAVGVGSLDELIEQTVPSGLHQTRPLSWEPLTEHQVTQKLREVAAKNTVLTSLIGQGYYGTVTPPVIQRNVFENPAWYTAYTPYQPEISQGRLEALLNFQTMVADLTGLPLANASLLDEPTAAAEAMAMAKRTAKATSRRFFAADDLHPQTIAVLATRAEPLGIDLVVGPVADFVADDFFGAIFAHPGTYGHVRNLTDQCRAVKDSGGIAVIATDLLALCLIKDPGSMGADIAIGSSQRFGVPMGFGGPHAAFMSCRDELKRALPGRLVGVSKDARGNRAYRLALQTREQHIRREKATSNVCTAQALLAVMASFYAVFHGPKGLRSIAQRTHLTAATLAAALRDGGAAVEPEVFFDTITVDVGVGQAGIIAAAEHRGINLRRIGRHRVGISVDETTDLDIVARVLDAFGIDERPGLTVVPALPDDLLRTTDYLTHPVFHLNRAESEMMRYMRRLSDRDLALDRAMIPLGSCTMKLNAAVEMRPLSWPGFAELHPYAPAHQTQGYAELIADLEAKLCEITGYDAFSMQPNSGAQGEYAGLLTIAAYHRANGDDRDVCLIPTSAHGTNPASAQMAGMKVTAVKATADGEIDLDDFRAKAAEAGGRLAAVMITYPSTHGVFEETVRQVCDITHEHGGQVYIDGANLNAMVGLVRPGEIGGDVSHLNLHKTFAIPHGGGGPGMGPIGVQRHLAPFLPSDPQAGAPGAVSGANHGSASILLVSWAYVLLMGGAGLTQATKVAILSANYLASRLAEAYPILYTGARGRVAHECIVDPRGWSKSGVTVDDIAKRLIDHGFHAPTMSFPVAGTLMFEPTESEPLAELDRFVAAMLDIAREARQVIDGEVSAAESPLRHAPHTVEDLVADWERSYSREQGCFPAGAFRVDKYWPAVGRIDNAYGDRNLVCSCPPWGEE
ncbi:aminomethyl-transferring glycine dehydrogenase [Tessaracoccus sp. MC1756]|uniref:aminomethyl-transferring glycine dehydrogenase n=1 Tax=Tessaracoccus sp. MC1756 TaxID=2760311 RepID=UPI001600CC40|nr:aminomethyl-transferring glycine dehydrogenase [Tessaracoccus sp. MC1756]MBB1508927.1 aminomethyl-transferring glycine dehydrogenase [Tessaracoccus sp. MC1756]